MGVLIGHLRAAVLDVDNFVHERGIGKIRMPDICSALSAVPFGTWEVEDALPRNKLRGYFRSSLRDLGRCAKFTHQ